MQWVIEQFISHVRTEKSLRRVALPSRGQIAAAGLISTSARPSLGEGRSHSQGRTLTFTLEIT